MFTVCADPVSDVTIRAPSQLTTARELPVGVQLVFGAVLNTTYGTSFTGDLYYNWVFASASHNTRTVTHMFDVPGPETVILSVIYAGTSIITTQLSINILGECGARARARG